MSWNDYDTKLERFTVRHPVTVGYQGPMPVGISGYQAQLLVRGDFVERKPQLFGEVFSLERHRLRQEVNERRRLNDLMGHIREETKGYR